eukprot:TRINITY_DN4598_c0_g1_i1.p2 TRINITY_DN4598_c0_g1~~TRINITY_DN4598_c0_g1_i1.p2  ORF type:complete len:123 (+),score=36.82 TRINITY_DN4598_c0_g1_i1:77-445(+)
MARRSALAPLLLAAAAALAVMQSLLQSSGSEQTFVGGMTAPARAVSGQVSLRATAPDDLKVRDTDIGFEEDYGTYQPNTFIREEDKKVKKEENIFAVLAMPLFYWLLAVGGVATYMNVFYQG